MWRAESGTGPGNNPSEKIVITPDTPSVVRGHRLTLTGQLVDSAGHAISISTLQWSSADTTIAKVDAHGVVTGIAFGHVQITAINGKISGSTQLAVLFPQKDSAAATTQDSTTIFVGHGSSVTIPPGTLPTGTTVTVQETSSTDSSGGIPVGRSLIITTSNATSTTTPASAQRLRPKDVRADIIGGSGPGSVGTYLIQTVQPFDYTKLNSGASNLGFSVRDLNASSATDPNIYAPVNPTVASTPLGPTTTATFTLYELQQHSSCR